MSQVAPLYGKACTCMMKKADAKAVPDMEAGWPGNRGLFDEVPHPDVEQLDKDLKNRARGKGCRNGAY